MTTMATDATTSTADSRRSDTLAGFDLQLMSWGDGSGVPTSGSNLVIVGIDKNGLLRIRIFDIGGNVTDETRLPSTQAGAISTLKQLIPGLLPPHALTGPEKAQLIGEVALIVGQPPLADPAGRQGAKRSAWSATTPVSPKWTPWHTASLLLIVIVICAVNLTLLPRYAFLASLGLMALFTTIAGHGVLGLWLGLLIDERNKMSLSRLQMITWTIVVLSGFVTAALWNTRFEKHKDPLSIAVPAQLWCLMGISTISLVGSPLIRSTKTADPLNTGETRSEAETKELARMKEELARQKVPPDTIDTQGKIVIWKWPEDARVADLFQGDELGNAAHLDLGKVQMFFFTVVLVLTYTVALARVFIHVSSPITELPPVDEGMVALFGISHAGFLMNNAAPHSVSR
jgi:hypothetical protein